MARVPVVQQWKRLAAAWRYPPQGLARRVGGQVSRKAWGALSEPDFRLLSKPHGQILAEYQAIPGKPGVGKPEFREYLQPYIGPSKWLDRLLKEQIMFTVNRMATKSALRLLNVGDRQTLQKVHRTMDDALINAPRRLGQDPSKYLPQAGYYFRQYRAVRQHLGPLRSSAFLVLHRRMFKQILLRVHQLTYEAG